MKWSASNEVAVVRNLGVLFVILFGISNMDFDIRVECNSRYRKHIAYYVRRQKADIYKCLIKLKSASSCWQTYVRYEKKGHESTSIARNARFKYHVSDIYPMDFISSRQTCLKVVDSSSTSELTCKNIFKLQQKRWWISLDWRATRLIKCQCSRQISLSNFSWNREHIEIVKEIDLACSLLLINNMSNLNYWQNEQKNMSKQNVLIRLFLSHVHNNSI